MASTKVVHKVFGFGASALGFAACYGKLRQPQPIQCKSTAQDKGHIDFCDVEARKNIAKKGMQHTVPDCTSAQEQVFAFLGWSPQPGSPCWTALHKNFPGSLPGPAILNRSRDILVAQGFTPENTIYGQSICPDEINNQKGMLADSLKEFWGECFPLGGIGGPPFVGQTGWGAFTAHVPQDGNIVVLFGPHVGITEAGAVGKVHRLGQSNDSTACGAFVAAYHSCCEGEVVCAEKHKYDMQQGYLKETLHGRAKDIQATPEPMAALAVHAFEIVKEKLEAVICDKLPDHGKLVLIGGVQINMPEGMQDHFFPLMFEMRAKGEEPVNFLHVFDCELTGKGSMNHS